jgi:hypothetical protein
VRDGSRDDVNHAEKSTLSLRMEEAMPAAVYLGAEGKIGF